MKKNSIWLAFVVSGFVSLIVFWMLVDNGCTMTGVLGTGESVNQCLTRWIGALSGWFGGLAALVGAWTAFTAIQRQIRLQQLHIRQTELLRMQNNLINEADRLTAVIGALNTLQNIRKAFAEIQPSDFEACKETIRRIPLASLNHILNDTKAEASFRSAVSVTQQLLEDFVDRSIGPAADFPTAFDTLCETIEQQSSRYVDKLSETKILANIVLKELKHCNEELTPN
ncbi:hypothetical protein [Roseibium sediminis]|uniref:hypothetical protein n=1 Tax=Roseibium sediminis TaxID=1775174 RepID=UPI00123CA247|nr:hypothetical protein [Roseibium sediminis]